MDHETSTAPSTRVPGALAAAAESYTILRVKRKRNEEPLDALVFEAQNRKRTKSAGKGGPSPPTGDTAAPGVSVFQFAETVEEAAWVDQAARARLQARITALARESSAQDQDRTLAGSPAQPELVAPGKPSSSVHDAPRVIAGIPQGKQPEASSSQSQARDAAALAKQRRYTIVAHDEQQQQDVSSVRFPTAPPKVLSAKALEAAKSQSQFNMYDAVLSSDASHRAPSPSAVDPEMDKFQTMLEDYLSMNDISLAANSPPLAPPRSRGMHRGGVGAPADTDTDETRIGAEEDEDDYVWDVFYYRPSLSVWNAVALSNFGSLTGLPPSVNNPDDSDSESEPEDEDDEDSNAEDYYKNDYPDEDDDWSDNNEQFHEDSDYDDFLRDEDDHDHDWR